MRLPLSGLRPTALGPRCPKQLRIPLVRRYLKLADRLAIQSLVVEFLGEEYSVTPGQPFSFGRSADLSIDDNQRLHRKLGLFDFADGMWWIHNVGSLITIEVADRNSPSRLSLAPGATMALVFEEASLRFRTEGAA